MAPTRGGGTRTGPCSGMNGAQCLFVEVHLYELLFTIFSNIFFKKNGKKN